MPLTAHASAAGRPPSWQRDAKARMEAAKRCEALALLRVDDGERFVGDLLDIGVDERKRIAAARGAPLPCAVLDKTGESLPIDVAPFGIERFDVNRTDWRGAFRAWLDARAARKRRPRRDRGRARRGHAARAALSGPAAVRDGRMVDLLRPGADDRRGDRPPGATTAWC